MSPSFLSALTLAAVISAPIHAITGATPAAPASPAASPAPSPAPTRQPTPQASPTDPPATGPRALPGAAPGASAAPSAAPSAKPKPIADIVRLGTLAVLTIRAPENGLNPDDRAKVVQSRIDQVVLDFPYLTDTDVKVLREGPTPVIFWGPFPIVSVDEAHTKLNNYSSPDVLAHTWANSLRRAIKTFMAAKVMPPEALYRNESGSDFIYKRTDKTFDDPRALRNTRFTFSPADLVYGVGVKSAGQRGFVVFVRRDDTANPPAAIYLGNRAATFTEYDVIPPDSP